MRLMRSPMRSRSAAAWDGFDVRRFPNFLSIGTDQHGRHSCICRCCHGRLINAKRFIVKKTPVMLLQERRVAFEAPWAFMRRLIFWRSNILRIAI